MPISNSQLRQKLPHIRKVLKPESRFDDYYLLRFLRARKGDVPAAIRMLQEHFTWRQVNQVDKLYYDHLDNPSSSSSFHEEEALGRVYPSGYWGLDKEGRIIYYERLGVTDAKSVLEVCSVERFLQYCIYQYEKLIWTRFPAARPKHVDGEYRDQSLVLIDLHGLSWDHVSSTSRFLFREIVRVSSRNYPEIMGRTLVLNAPKVFPFIWLAVKGFIDEETRQKILVFPGNAHDAVDHYVNHHGLPDFLGGRVHGVSGAIDYGPWQDDSRREPPVYTSRSPSEHSFVSCIDDEPVTSVACWMCPGIWS